MKADGITRVAAVLTSAYSSYSGCRQYRENLAAAFAEVPDAPRIDRLRHYFNHPGFIESMVDATLSALADLPEDARRGGHIAFVTHSIPVSMNDSSGPRGGAYVAQHRAVAAEIIERVREETGHRYPSEVVFCSRSGQAHIPWLEPDINDHLRSLRQRDAPGVVAVPIGFVSDHMEVVYDLDHEARATAEEIGLPFARAATAGSTRGSSPWSATSCSNAAPSSAVSRSSGRRQGPTRSGTCVPPAAAPTRAARSRRCAARTDPVSELGDLLELATATAREAGDLVTSMRTRGVDVAQTKSSPIDIVTEADRACEELIRRRLLGARPDDAFVGEEGHDIVGSSGVSWVVDPIDGTVNYLYGLPHYAVSIAAARDGEVVAGVVRGPALEVEYAATLGGGATRNGVPIQVRATPPLDQALVSTGFSYETDIRTRQADAIARMLPQVATSGARDRAPSTSVRWLPARVTGTSRRGPTPGTTQPEASSPRRQEPPSRSGRPSPTGTWWCAHRPPVGPSSRP